MCAFYLLIFQLNESCLIKTAIFEFFVNFLKSCKPTIPISLLVKDHENSWDDILDFSITKPSTKK